MAESEHLVARERQAYGTLERFRRKCGKEKLILRAKPRTEATAYKRRLDTHFVFRIAEDLGHI